MHPDDEDRYRERKSSMAEDEIFGEELEIQKAMLHTAQTGGDPPTQALLRDW